MSERGSFVTEYCHCNKCFEGLKKVLLQTNKYICSSVPPSWCSQEIPIIGGKIGGSYDGEEIDEFDITLRVLIEQSLCYGHSITIAVMASGGQKEFIEFYSRQRKKEMSKERKFVVKEDIVIPAGTVMTDEEMKKYFFEIKGQ